LSALKQGTGVPLTLAQQISGIFLMNLLYFKMTPRFVSRRLQTGRYVALVVAFAFSLVLGAPTAAAQDGSSSGIDFAPITSPVVGTSVELSASTDVGWKVSFSSATPGTCIVLETTASFINQGTCTITAYGLVSGGGPWGNTFSQASVSQSVQVAFVSQPSAGLTSQTISFDPIPTQAVGGQLWLTGSASSGLPVSFSSSTPTICMVSSGTVSLMAAGTCAITATQTGNSMYAPATPVSQTFLVVSVSQPPVGLTPQTVTINYPLISPTQVVGTSVLLSAFASASSGLPVAFTTTTPSICSISGDIASLNSIGFCWFYASQAGNATYAAATTVGHLFFVGKSQTITFAPVSAQTVDTSIMLSTTTSSGLPVSFFTSETPSVCEPGGNNTVWLGSAGTCTIEAQQLGDSTYAAAPPVSQTFAVVWKAQAITFGPIAAQKVGGSLTLSASSNSGLWVTFSSNTPSVCTISGNWVSLVTAGTCSTSASQSGGYPYSAAAPVLQTFAVTSKSQTITFNSIQKQMVGDSLNLLAVSTSGLPISFSSYSASICTVSGNIASFVSPGTCTIAATQSGDAVNPPAAPVLQTFAVFATQTITFNSVPTQTAGSSLTLNATASSGLPITYNSVGACTVSGSMVSLFAVGTCEITASQPGTSLYQAAQDASIVVNVSGVGLQFIPLTPCRVADTRNADGPFGGPEITAGTTRSFAVPQANCGIPITAAAYSLNVTAVPSKTLGFLTIWPTGLPKPGVSTLNSWDGRIKANAAIVGTGKDGSVSVYVSDASHVVLDINGYFVPAANPSALAFYPTAPCRIADTRNPVGPFGGVHMTGGETRSFTIPASACNIPDTAGAYSLNFTVVPHSKLGYLSTWPTGQPKPLVSTLNAFTGEVTSNAAILPAGTSGSISVYVTDDADVVIDANGYFGPQTSGGLSFYSISPCRVLDTRIVGDKQPFLHTREVNVTGSACGIPPTAQTVVTNATVVPEQKLGFLSLWPEGEAQPYVSTLNAFDGSTTSDMAIIPMTQGSVDAYVTDPTHLILDASGYFAP
jgi:hypothetical protein